MCPLETRKRQKCFGTCNSCVEQHQDSLKDEKDLIKVRSRNLPQEHAGENCGIEEWESGATLIESKEIRNPKQRVTLIYGNLHS